MPVELESKKQAVANALNGTVVDATGRVAVSIKGIFGDYPITFEAFLPHWPFGVMYIIESSPGVDPSSRPTRPNANITLYPRVGRGVGSIVSNILLFEGTSMRISNKRLQGSFNFNFDNEQVADRLFNNEQIENAVFTLDDSAKFSEMKIRTDAGIFLSQPKSFNSLDPDHIVETFATLAQIADVLVAEF